MGCELGFLQCEFLGNSVYVGVGLKVVRTPLPLKLVFHESVQSTSDKNPLVHIENESTHTVGAS